MKKRFTRLAMGLCFILFSASASAALIDLAPDWRGQEGTTLQQWEFFEPVPSTAPIMPDAGWVNPNGAAQLLYYPGSTTGWKDQIEGHRGVVPLSGAIKIEIPNFPVANPYKEIVVQLIWAAETPIGKPCVQVISGHNPDGDLLTAEQIMTDGLDGPWHYSKYKIRLEPNPEFEQIWISGSVWIDSIIVDTICVPEPATMVLLGLGCLVLRKGKGRVV